MAPTRSSVGLVWLGLLPIVPLAAAAPPLAQHGYSRLTSPAEIHADLEALASRPGARLEQLGRSVLGRELAALVLEPAPDPAEAEPLTVLLVGSQHGAAEAAGAETLLALAHELASDPRGEWRRGLRVIVLPDANPDGRALGRRANAHRVNLNTDYVLLSQPESRAVLGAVQRFRPEVVLDLHESTVLKRDSLAREGYLTDFDAQFETGNNPALAPEVATFAGEVLLPEIVARVSAAGLPAQRYLAEIRSVHQPVTNGGLSLRNLRNRAAAGGAASFLLETRLDPRDGHYPTYRNIAARVARQRLCLTHFIAVLREHAGELRRRVELARGAAPRTPLLIDPRYTGAAAAAPLMLSLRRIADGGRVTLPFPDHRAVTGWTRVTPPNTYLVMDHVAAIRELLDRQGLRSTIATAPGAAEVLALDIGTDHDGAAAVRATHRRTLAVPAGSLYVELAQPEGRALAMLLDPRSTSSLFREPAFAPLLRVNEEFFVYGVFEGVTPARGVTHAAAGTP